MADPDLSVQSIPSTADQIADDMIAIAQALGLAITSWVEGSPWLTLVYAVADTLEDVGLAVVRIAANAYLGPGGARGIWLDRKLESDFDDERIEPVFTVGQVTLEDHGGGPHTIEDGNFLVKTAGGLQFRVISGGGSLALNGSLPVVVRGVAAGAAYNVANDAISALVTAAPTVTVSNPAVGTSGTWITTLGSDIESDDAATKRARLKWSTLATGSPVAAYLYWALSTPGVTRASVDDGNPDGPNTVRVYVDNAGSVAALQATLNVKAPDGRKATAMAATTQTVTIPAVVTTLRAYRDAAQAEAEANLVELQNATDIGGRVIKSEVIERIMTPLGVTDVEVASSWAGSPNIQLTPGNIVQFTLALEWLET